MKMTIKPLLENATKIAALSFIAFFFSNNLAAQTRSNLLVNPGLENRPGGTFQGWQETDPLSESEKTRSGSKSAKISGQTGRLAQTVTVTPFTDYTFSGYVLNYGRLGVLLADDEKKEKRIHGAEEWTKAEVKFNSGSSSSIEVYANYYREEGRYDDFSLTPQYAARSSITALKQCPEIGDLPISVASDDGSNDNNPPENVIDGNLSNRWSSKGVGKTITLDLNRTAEVSVLDVMWYKGNERISLFSVETSIDGQSWQMILSNASSTQKSGFDSYDIANLINPEARFVRIIGEGNSSSEWNSITEVKIKGCVP